MLTVSEVQSKLKGYPPAIFEDYNVFFHRRDPESLHAFVLGVVAFLIDQNHVKDLNAMPDSTNLRDDLQIESITIAETIFILEDIFEVEISNDDIISMKTLGDLKQFLNSIVQ